MSELCRVWADLAADPESAAAVAAAHTRFVDLVEHMNTCDACGLISESMPFPERVFAVLGDENLDLSREELKAIREMDTVLADDPSAIASGVEFLLAGLPRALDIDLDPLRIFRAIDAVSVLLRSAAASDPQATIDAVPRAAAVSAIARHADVPEAVAESLWNWQLEVVERCPTLYDASTPDLLVRWQMPRTLGSKQELIDILNELKEAVAAQRSLPSSAADKTFGEFVEQIHRENAKIIEMMAPLVVTGDDDQEDADRHAAPKGSTIEADTSTSMVAVVQNLRMAERRKRRWLSAIANAPKASMDLLAAIGRREDAMKLRTFAAKSQVVAARNIIELERLEKL